MSQILVSSNLSKNGSLPRKNQAQASKRAPLHGQANPFTPSAVLKLRAAIIGKRSCERRAAVRGIRLKPGVGSLERRIFDALRTRSALKPAGAEYVVGVDQRCSEKA
jgi:hypothetical protein